MADQDIEIKVDELPEVEIKVDAAGDAKGAAPGRVPAELGVDDLKRQVDEARLQAERERNARAEAERRAQQNEQQVRRYAGEVQDSQYHIIANAIDATQKESAAIKRDYAEALERGDYAVAADLQERLSDARHRLGTLQQGRDALEMQRQAPPRTEGRVEQPRQPAAPPTPEQQFEGYVRQFTQRTQEFMRRHPQVVTDRTMNFRATAAHNDAMAENLQPDTDAYFDFVERRLGLRQDSRQNGRQDNQRRAPVAAPVSRDAPSMSTGRSADPMSVRLTAAEQEMAQMQGFTNEEYARHKAALIREGKLSA